MYKMAEFKLKDYTEYGVRDTDMTVKESPVHDYEFTDSLEYDAKFEVDALGTTTGGIFRTNRSPTRIEVNNINNALYIYVDGAVRAELTDGALTFYTAAGDVTSTFSSTSLGFNTQLGVGSGAIYGSGTNQLTLDTGGSTFDFTDSGLSINAVLIWSGSGSPENAVAAPVGSLWLRTDGGAGTSLYVKESGSGNTGWVGK